jgi:hypothetical protein
VRAFKTRRFAKDAKAAGIGDAELCEAVSELEKSQGDSLGGGVWKKRLDKNRYRSIVLTKPGAFWLFVYLYAKKDREDIAPDELVSFKKLARDYAAAKPKVWESMLDSGDLKEICNDEKDKEGKLA